MNGKEKKIAKRLNINKKKKKKKKNVSNLINNLNLDINI
jgi:hypothetical protein